MASSLPKRIRWAGLIFPPAGILLLWRERSLSPVRRALGMVLFLCYGLVYGVVLLLLAMALGLVQLEWRGGFPPVLTFHKTLPDYAAVEADRARQAHQSAVSATALELKSSPVPEDWVGFRGPNRDGHYDQTSVLTEWPAEGLTPLWKQPIGGGYASFAIAGDRAYTIEQRRDQEAVVAYDVDHGRELWAHVYPARFEESMGGEGPRATPLWDDGKVYSMGCLGDFKCLDAASGQLLWAHNVLREENADNLYYGCSASPLVVDDMIIAVGGKGGQALLAYDKRTGASTWKAVPEKPAYTSPMLVTLADQRQVLTLTSKHAWGVNPENGTVLWSFPWSVSYDNNIAQPVILSSNRFLLSAGYGTGCVAVEVSKSESGFSVRELWRNRFLKNKFTSSVFHEGFIYGLDEDILTCLSAETGKRQWKDGRYDYGQLLLADGHLIVLTGRGELALVEATPEAFRQKALFPAITGKTWNHPALCRGRLFVRNAVEMACFQIGKD